MDESSNQTSTLSIPELGLPGTSSASSSPSLQKKRKYEETTPDNNNQSHQFSSQPIISTIFTDPETKKEKALVLFHVSLDIKDIKFSLSEEGERQFLVVTYEWPETMVDATKIFTKNNTMILPQLHPQVCAVENALKQFKRHIDDKPMSCMKICLEARVKDEPKMWEKTFIKDVDLTRVFVTLPLVGGDDYATSDMERVLVIS